MCSGVIWGWGFGELLLDVIHDEAHEAPPAQGKLRCHDVSKAILIEVILVLRCYKDITKRVTAFGGS